MLLPVSNIAAVLESSSNPSVVAQDVLVAWRWDSAGKGAVSPLLHVLGSLDKDISWLLFRTNSSCIKSVLAGSFNSKQSYSRVSLPAILFLLSGLYNIWDRSIQCFVAVCCCGSCQVRNK